MTTKRTYSSRDEVCHAFAHQRVDEGKAGNIFFIGKLIYSYGRHFCMARLIGDRTVLITTQGYSQSTASHISKLRSAVNHMQRFFTWDPENPFSWDAIEHTMRKVHECIDSAAARQKWRTDLRDNDIRAANNIYGQMEELRRLAKTWPKEDTEGWSPWPRHDSDIAKKWKALGKLLSGEFDGIVEARAKLTERQRKAADKRMAEAARKAAEARKLDMEIGEVQLEGWQRYEPVTGRNFMRSLDHHGLRISQVDRSLVETTLGQSVPAKDCIDVWPMLKTIYLTGRHMENGYRIGNDARQVTLGGFRVDFIDSAGNLHVGCHTFKKETVYRLASDLGLS